MGRAQCNWLLVVNKCPVLKDVGNYGLCYVHPVPDNIWPAGKPYRIGLLVTHKNGDFLYWSEATPRRSITCSDIYRIAHFLMPHFGPVWTGIWIVADSERGLESTETDVNILEWGQGFAVHQTFSANRSAGYMLRTCSSHCDVDAHTIPDSISGMSWA